MHRQVLEEQNGLEGVCIWTSDESWRVTLHLVSALSSSWEEPVLCAGTVTGSSCLSAASVGLLKMSHFPLNISPSLLALFSLSIL